MQTPQPELVDVKTFLVVAESGSRAPRPDQRLGQRGFPSSREGHGTRESAWLRMQVAGVQLVGWFAMACELHRDWRNDIEGLGQLFSEHIPNYRNLMNSYSALAAVGS